MRKISGQTLRFLLKRWSTFTCIRTMQKILSTVMNWMNSITWLWGVTSAYYGPKLGFNSSFPFSDLNVMYPVYQSQTTQPKQISLSGIMTSLKYHDLLWYIPLVRFELSTSRFFASFIHTSVFFQTKHKKCVVVQQKSAHINSMLLI